MKYFTEKNCLRCNNTFIDKTKNQIKKFCSKGCKSKTNNEDYPKTIIGKYNNAKKEITRARNQRKENPKKWLLSLNEYNILVENNECYYCGDVLPTYGVSLDRINSNGHYEKSNVVACCKNCNAVKYELLSLNEMQEVVKLLKRIRQTEYIWK